MELFFIYSTMMVAAMASNCGKTGEYGSFRDEEESGYGLICGTIPAFNWRDWGKTATSVRIASDMVGIC